tara:strand:+ start:91 stop:393 length:303 start_codon:yes stop_codon:yes gene_type:complete
MELLAVLGVIFVRALPIRDRAREQAHAFGILPIVRHRFLMSRAATLSRVVLGMELLVTVNSILLVLVVFALETYAQETMQRAIVTALTEQFVRAQRAVEI